ncbi:hypothetical protein X975_25355, partial [Stegodyphus mimosarum]
MICYTTICCSYERKRSLTGTDPHVDRMSLGFTGLLR